MTDRPDLEALGAELQRELRLQDWRVTYAYVVGLCDASGAPVYGLCDRLVDNKTATILIRDPAEPLPEGVEAKSVEGILIHELAHLHMAPLAVDTPQGVIDEEQAVWPLADALTKWRGTARGPLLARAMSMRGPQKVTRARSRSKRMNRSELAMLKAAMGDGKDPEASMKGVAAALEAYEASMGAEDDAPESEKGEGQPARTEEAAPEKPKEARAAEVEPKEPKAAKAAIRIDDVRREAALATRAEFKVQTERAALIEANKDLFGVPERAVLGTLALSVVKSMVAARRMAAPPKAADAGKRSARIHVGPMVLADSDDSGLTPEQVAAMNRLMNVGGKAPPAVSRTATGGVALSHLATETVGEQLRRMAALGAAK